MADTTYIYQILGAVPGTDASLSRQDLEAVRGALGLTASEVPDELVHQLGHAPAAEMQIIRDFPTAATQTANDLAQVIIACRLLTAAYIAPTIAARIAKQERIEGAVSVTNFELKWDEISQRLRKDAYEALYAVSDYMDLVVGVGVEPEDIPGLPIARANGWSRDRILRGEYPGFVVK